MPSQEKNRARIEALGLPAKIRDQECLNGLAQIAAYMGCSITKVRRLINNGGMPATRYGNGQYFTAKEVIIQWLKQGHLNMVISHDWDKRLMHTRVYPRQDTLRT